MFFNFTSNVLSFSLAAKIKHYSLNTYLNESGKPIMRNCGNCKHFAAISDIGNERDRGYCTVNSCMFAPTMLHTVHFMVRHFYLCDKHTFKNEQHLKDVSTSVNMRDYLKPKSETHGK